MGYVKSHSNYVIKARHQHVNDGTIYERDITTIGGRDKFAPGQIPMYNGSNFVITINSDANSKKNLSNQKWEENENGAIWTMKEAEAFTNLNTNARNHELSLNKEYYNFRDFCYYGSAVELIRASIVDIMTRFPGELYPKRFGDEGVNHYLEDGDILGDETLYALDNPFGIDVHSKNTPDGGTSIGWFANKGFMNYEVLDDEGTPYEIIGWTSTPSGGKCVKDKAGEIEIEITGPDASQTLVIYAYIGDGREIVYLVDEDYVGKGWHIIPKESFYNDFMDSLDPFQSILLNRGTEPKYKATFEVMGENASGEISNRLMDFVMPVGHGGYNLGGDGPAYASYLSSLESMASFYDENYCDNLYRNMTHEAISNLSESIKKYGDGDELIVYDDNKIKAVIRLWGRELDIIKAYIDGINDANTITYNGAKGIPDYLMTDALETDGWDIRSVIPFSLSEYILGDDGKKEIVEDASVDEEKGNTRNGQKLHRNFSQNPTETITPYTNGNSIYPYGYYLECVGCGEGGGIEKVGAEKDDPLSKIDCSGTLRNLIRNYTDEIDYTMDDANLHFLRMLRMCSRELWRHKGTIDGIEMLLAIFGMKSKRWVDSLGRVERAELADEKPDYDIKEYTTFTNGIVDKYSEQVGMHKLDWYNYTKMVAYDTEESRNGTYLPYQGLPVAWMDNEDGSRTLFPYFNNSAYYDGAPYYQMKGGWMRRGTMCFDLSDNVVTAEQMKLHKDTLRHIVSVDDMRELFAIDGKSLTDGDIVYVRNTDNRYLIVDGKVYDIYTDWYNKTPYDYIVAKISNGSMVVGNTRFNERINVYNPISGVDTIVFANRENGEEIKLYLDEDGKLNVSNDEESVGESAIFDEPNGTHFFRINNTYYTSSLSEYGWSQLKDNDPEYLKVNCVTDYFKGNNPHCGHGKYDDGYAYMDYFVNLFGYQLDNELFDARCYKDKQESYETATEDLIPTIGFHNILGKNDKCGYDYSLIEDDKVHFFGDLADNDMTVKKYGDEIHITDIETVRGGESKYGDSIEDYTENDSDCDDIKGAEVCDNTCQIMNTKVIEINFNMKSGEEFSPEWLKEAKYIDAVILPYVEQMMPPSAICRVNYLTDKSKKFKPIDYIVVTFSWGENDGKDLDIVGEVDTIREMYDDTVGFGQPNHNKFMVWTDDNRHKGNESIYLDVKGLMTKYGDELKIAQKKQFSMDLWGRWKARRLEGNVKIEIHGYYGGEMVLEDDGYTWKNVGGYDVGVSDNEVNVEKIGGESAEFRDTYSKIGKITYTIADKSIEFVPSE